MKLLLLLLSFSAAAAQIELRMSECGPLKEGESCIEIRDVSDAECEGSIVDYTENQDICAVISINGSLMGALYSMEAFEENYEEVIE